MRYTLNESRFDLMLNLLDECEALVDATVRADATPYWAEDLNEMFDREDAVNDALDAFDDLA